MRAKANESILAYGPRVTCPVCKQKMRRSEIRQKRLTCPSCRESLRVRVPRDLRWISVLLVLLALLITYATGVGGYEFLLVAPIVYLLLCAAVGIIGSWFFLRLERDGRTEVGDEVLRLFGPGDPPSKTR